MASDDEKVTTDEKVRRSVARTVGSGAIALLLLGGLGAWASLGVYQLDPGQAAIILRLGRHVNTVGSPGLNWHLPPPIEEREVVNVAQIQRQEFGVPTGADPEADRRARLEATMQTGDNNIVKLAFVVQYRIQDAFAARYRIASPVLTLRDAAEAAMREVVGRMPIDGVLSERRGDVEGEAEEVLQQVLDGYDSGLLVLAVQLQEVQPPDQVAAAFDDVIAAGQDASRIVNEAEGYRNELLPRSRAEAAELIEAARAYREAKVAESTGEAARFLAIAAEHRKAPDVTEMRLYLETMEEVLPGVEKVIVEPGSTGVFPHLPLGRGEGGIR